MRQTGLQTPRSVKKEGENVLQAPEQISHCHPQKRLSIVVCLLPVELRGRAEIHLQDMEDLTLHPTEGSRAPLPFQAVGEEQQPLGSTHIGKVHGGLPPMGETSSGVGEKREESYT